MNPLVRAYLTARLRRLETDELRRLAKEVRERQAEARPALERLRAERKENARLAATLLWREAGLREIAHSKGSPMARKIALAALHAPPPAEGDAP